MRNYLYLTYRLIGLWIIAFIPFILDFKNLFNGKIIKGFIKYIKDWSIYSSLNKDQSFLIKKYKTYPIFVDSYDSAGAMPRHYFKQDIWAARKIFNKRAPIHYDIGSRLDGFIAHCICFTKVAMIDIRPLKIIDKNITFIQADCTKMDGICSESVDSISSLHALEHFGLGRYGDPVNPLAYLEAISEIERVCSGGGDIYIAVPISNNQRLEFNAQRVFNPLYFKNCFVNSDLIEFSYIDDDDVLHELADIEKGLDIFYGCGLFHFQKKITI